MSETHWANLINHYGFVDELERKGDAAGELLYTGHGVGHEERTTQLA